MDGNKFATRQEGLFDRGYGNVDDPIGLTPEVGTDGYTTDSKEEN